jgi:neutral ceramidase
MEATKMGQLPSPWRAKTGDQDSTLHGTANPCTRESAIAVRALSGFFLGAMTLPRLLCLAALLPLFLHANDPEKPLFRAGAATGDVTAPLGTSMNGGFHDREATYIHDPQLVRCLALDDGTMQVVLVLVDSCVIGRDVFDEAKAMVEKASGLPASHLLMSATHSHSCGTMQAVGQSEPDPLYQRFVARRIADTARCAIQNLEPAEVAWGVGSVPQHVFNRRYEMKEGGIPPTPLGVTDDRVRTNPGVGNPLVVRPAGPTDPEVPFLAVRNLEGRPLALYANYALHYVGGTGPGHVSADYFGAFARLIGDRIGATGGQPPFVGMISNGASGDINNVDVLGEQEKLPPYGQIELVAGDVAAEVARVYAGLSWHHHAPLAAVQRELALGVRKPSGEELEKARETMGQSKIAPRMETLEQVYARESVLLADFPDEVSAPLQVVGIGGLRLAAMPAEVFVEIGLELKARHPGTTVVSLANAYHGYLPTPEHHALGGYETWRARSSYLEVEASTKMVKLLDEMLASLGKPGE